MGEVSARVNFPAISVILHIGLIISRNEFLQQLRENQRNGDERAIEKYLDIIYQVYNMLRGKSARVVVSTIFIVSFSRANYSAGPNSSTAAGKSKKRGREGNREELR